jgi:hypothetical protein
MLILSGICLQGNPRHFAELDIECFKQVLTHAYEDNLLYVNLISIKNNTEILLGASNKFAIEKSKKRGIEKITRTPAIHKVMSSNMSHGRAFNKFSCFRNYHSNYCH